MTKTEIAFNINDQKKQTMKAKKEVLENNSRTRVAAGYTIWHTEKKRKFLNPREINEVINKRAKRGYTLHEERKSDRTLEKNYIKKVRLGLLKPLGEAANSYYGHLYGIDAK